MNSDMIRKVTKEVEIERITCDSETLTRSVGQYVGSMLKQSPQARQAVLVFLLLPEEEKATVLETIYKTARDATKQAALKLT